MLENSLDLLFFNFNVIESESIIESESELEKESITESETETCFNYIENWCFYLQPKRNEIKKLV